MKTHNFVLKGVVEFLTKEELKRYGYTEDVPRSALYYKETIHDTDFYKTNKTHKILFKYTVKKIYDLEEGQELFPELFI